MGNQLVKITVTLKSLGGAGVSGWMLEIGCELLQTQALFFRANKRGFRYMNEKLGMKVSNSFCHMEQWQHTFIALSQGYGQSLLSFECFNAPVLRDGPQEEYLGGEELGVEPPESTEAVL